MKRTICVIWKNGPVEGSVELAHGTLSRLALVASPGKTGKTTFRVKAAGEVRLLVECADVRTGAGANATRVTVNTVENPFTFFLRDVTRQFPVFIPAYGVAVTVPADTRSYADLAGEIAARGLVSNEAAIEAAPEETYEDACRRNRVESCPTWLGLGRDIRFFRVHHRLPSGGGFVDYGCFGVIEPFFHAVQTTLPELDNQPYHLPFFVGPGSACRTDITRRLEEGCLPILRAVQKEEDVTYDVTAFATLETQPLAASRVRGTDWQAAYRNTSGNMLKPEDIEKIHGLLDAEMRGREEEVVCCVRIVAVNHGSAPRYAWFKAAHISRAKLHAFNGRTGESSVGPDRIYAVHRMDGRAMPEEEQAVLLQPGASAVFEMLVPHQPISAARARRLGKLDFDLHLKGCRSFWKGKLASAARIHVPEAAIDERIRAGLLHCDLVTLGKTAGGPLLATIGWYSPIGSESSPIIQFFDSMGWHKLAERSLDFFLARQRDDGFIQNFGGYQLETGPALWSMGEHYRYTRDDAWVKRIKPKLLKSCEFLLAWRTRNKRPELRGKGYGLLDGKVADPNDFFHSFMLNGLSYLGLQRSAEMLANVDPAASSRLKRECRAFLRDIRKAFYEALARSPAIPLGDGTWIPTVPPWTEYPGPVGLYADGGNWFTHGSFGSRDSIIGALYLVISEVLQPDEAGTDFMLQMNQRLFTVENAALTQPYYCRHDHIHVARGEVKPFLKLYYNQMTALQDRETYTFWEHYFHAGQHKTHEEGWFLMQTRWMLWFEQGRTLSLLRAIPRRWLADGAAIRLDKVASYFGPLSVKAESHVRQNLITVQVTCEGKHKPATVLVRVPHPDGLKAVKVEGGRYDAATETVRIARFNGKAALTVHF